MASALSAKVRRFGQPAHDAVCTVTIYLSSFEAGITEELCSVARRKSDAVWTHTNKSVQASIESVSQNSDLDPQVSSSRVLAANPR
jgi:hypothetical protein